MQKYFWLLLLIFLYSQLFPQEKSITIPLIYEPFKYAVVPPLGVGHYVNEDYENGLIFTFLEGVPYYLVKTTEYKYSGDTVKYSLQPTSTKSFRKGLRSGTSPEDYFHNRLRLSLYMNYYNTIGIDEYLAYRKLRINETNKIPSTSKNIWELSLSPFRWKYLKDPEVYIPILINMSYNIYDNYNKPHLWDVKKINVFGKDINAYTATAANLILEFIAMSLVAMSEEMIYRGIIQTELSERVNKRFGLIASSLLFGLVHLRNHDLVYSIRAAVAGLYMGWQFQKYNYDLGRVMAIHFYIDFTPSIVAALLNPLGLRFSYSSTR